jgi:hypothetical protein
VSGLVEFFETSGPRLIAFNEYVNEAGDEVTVVQFASRWTSPTVNLGGW